MNLRERVRESASGSGYGSVVGFFEHGDVSSIFIKVGNFFANRINVNLLRKTLHHEVNYY
jgi:hypothetical protein